MLINISSQKMTYGQAKAYQDELEDEIKNVLL